MIESHSVDLMGEAVSLPAASKAKILTKKTLKVLRKIEFWYSMKNWEKLHLLRKIMWYAWKLQSSHYMDFNCIFHGLEFAYKTMKSEWENIICAHLYDSISI